jgi:hypothetical protein
MPLYICDTCNFSSTIKTHHQRHINTTKHRVKMDCCESELVVYGANDKKTQKDQVKTKKDQLKTKKDQINLEKKKKYFYCGFCDLGYSTYAHKRRHELHKCKMNYDQILNDKDDEIKQLKNEKTEIYKKIDKLLDKVGNTTNIQTNNIHLNNYGQEDLSHISYNMLNKLLAIPYGMIPKMIEAVHFNDDKPENKNIVLPNKKDNFVKIFKDNKWIYQDKNKAIDSLVDDNYNTIDNHYELIEQKEIIGKDVKTNYLKFKQFYDDGDKEFIEKLKKDCEMILLNNR